MGNWRTYHTCVAGTEASLSSVVRAAVCSESNPLGYPRSSNSLLECSLVAVRLSSQELAVDEASDVQDLASFYGAKILSGEGEDCDSVALP